DPHLPHVERKVNVGADLRVRLQRTGRLWIKLDPGDRSLARARLHVASGSSGVRLWRQVPRGKREIVIDEIPLGTYVVEVAAPGVLGTAGAVVTVAVAPKEPTLVKVVAGRSAQGRVVLRTRRHAGKSAQTVADVAADRGTVTLLDGDPLRVLATTRIEADGGFLLDGLPPGPLLLAAAVPGVPVAVQRVDLTKADGAGIVFVLEPPTEAAIVLETVAARGIARVRVVMDVGVEVRDAAAHGRFRRVVAADEDVADVISVLTWKRNEMGRIAVPFLQPGSYRFHVTAEGYKPSKVGVRARRPESEAMLRSLPDMPEDWATPVRLAPDLGDDSGTGD
ncbi:MAG: carboxypeptidase-like regulatory domain-containing protein, partial [Planctomycetota bacterium]|nr:carboxypeptidase-like regulatory domain-containing protein [Planctomycetota bacterium]